MDGRIAWPAPDHIAIVALGRQIHAGCSNRAIRRNRNGRGSNRHWMKVQWQVTTTFEAMH
ncbi:MAG: hypothetical protein EOR47_22700 [Mesorhizobium sp.]|nr:MAG: hypothetical protein EOR47_22700 [Mesorhizobium sp.]